MAKTSLANFVISMNRQFWRIKLPFGKGTMLRFYNAAGCCLSHCKMGWGSEGIFSWVGGVGDVLWAILVHEASAAANRLPDIRTGWR